MDARRSPGTAKLTVGFILADRFTLSAFSLFVDHLRLAADEGDRSRPVLCRWDVMGGQGAAARSSCGVTVSCLSRYPDPAIYDYLVVVGGLLQGGPQVSPECEAYLRRAAACGVRLVGLCTGSFVLTRAGVMTGRRCCVSWFHHQDFLDEFPGHHPVSDTLYVIDGDRITCSGGTGSADLAQHIVERHLGAAIAQKSRHVLLADRPRPGDTHQPHPPSPSEIADPRVRAALMIMEQNIREPLPLEEIADRLRLSRRQMERLFQTTLGAAPGMIYLRMRLDYARLLLRTTRRSVTDIAFDSGFRDCSHFTRKFKAQFGVRPTQGRTEPSQTNAGCLAGTRVFASGADSGILSPS